MPYEDYSITQLAADERFIRWVRQSNQADQQFWEQWLLDHPQHRATITEARQVVLRMQFQQDADTSQRIQALWDRIQQTNQTPVQPKRIFLPQWRQGHPWRNWQKMAAVFAGSMLLFAALYFTVFTEQFIEYQTADGQTKEIKLPDGSIVTLNANSSLRLSTEWAQDREVWLKGEAFFSVKHKPLVSISQPGKLAKFIVHTPRVRVQVLGTEFNVSERQQKTMVVLQSGKIELSLPSENQQFLMQPGDLIAFSDRERKLTQKKVNPAVYSAWTKHEWILDQLSLADVAHKIEETYGVTVVITQAKSTKTVVDGVVPTGNLDQLLEALATAFEVKINRSDNTIVIE